VNRRTKFLLLALGVSVVFALWQWFRPYDWNPDPAARFKVAECIVERDHSNLWLRVFLTPRKGEVMDYSKPIHLLTAGGKQHEPAQMEQVGPEGQGPASSGPPEKVESIVFSFWLGETDFAGPMKLELNGASLEIRDGNTLPGLAEGSFRVFNSSGW
jgi:hypothetical protein